MHVLLCDSIAVQFPAEKGQEISFLYYYFTHLYATHISYIKKNVKAQSHQ